MGTRSGLRALAAIAALSAGTHASGTDVDLPLPTRDGPILFDDLSNASGGPVDFGSPRSDVEKATCAFFDADGDGWDDLVTLAGGGEGCRFFLNRPDGNGGRTFVAAPAGNGLSDGAPVGRDGASITVADVDGDGDQDVYIGCGFNATLPVHSGRNMLLLNDGTGRFTNVALALGLADGDNTTAACVFFDMDLDGDLDLLTCNTRFKSMGKAGDGKVHLFRNRLSEDGTLGFVDESDARGVAEADTGTQTAIWNVLATDYDGDGDPDLVIGHDVNGPTRLLRNDGTGHFTDVSDAAGSGAGDDQSPSTFGDDSENAMGASSADIDNDGDLDLYVSNIAVDAPAAGDRHNPLYVNQGDGTFTDLARSRGVPGGTVGWGVTFADFDLDGWIDLYVAGGDTWGESRQSVRPWLYRNLGGGTFADVWSGSGMRHDVPLHRESGTASADFDRDGRPDLLVTRGDREGASPYLYRNVSDTHGRHWIEVRLVGNGTTTNRDAIGAKLRVHPRDATGARIAGLAQLREVVGGDSRSSRSSLDQHAGLGPDAVSADLEIEWPRAGEIASRRAVYVDVPIDALVVVTEAPRTEVWRLAAEAATTVPDVRATVVACSGIGAPDPLTSLRVESGPGWLAAGPWDGGRTLRATPSRVTEVTSFPAVVVADAQNAASDAESRQALTVRVVPAPSFRAVHRRCRHGIVVFGDHLDVAGLVFAIDGMPLRLRDVRAHRRAGGVTEQRALLRMPRTLARSLGKGRHDLVATEPVAGFIAVAEIPKR
jgi:hypothetical protein